VNTLLILHLLTLLVNCDPFVCAILLFGLPFVIAHDKLYYPVLPEVSPLLCHDGLAHSQFYDDGLAHIELYPEVSPSLCHDGLAHSQFYDDGLAHIELYPEVSPSLCHDGLAHSQFYDEGLALSLVYHDVLALNLAVPGRSRPHPIITPFCSCVTSSFLTAAIDSSYAYSNLKVAQYIYIK